MPGQDQTEVKETKFNLRTHVWDARGRLKSRNNYRLHVENGAQYFERPVNSGNLFYENNEPAGRVEFIKDEKGRSHKKFDFDAEHRAYTAPLTGHEKMHFENESLKSENAKLLAELQAIKAESDAKTAAKTEGQAGKPEQKPASNLAAAVGGTKPTAGPAITGPAKDNEL